MKKINNKGFLLVESLVVSMFVLTILLFMYVQFQTLSSVYERNITYNNVETLYKLDNIKIHIGRYAYKNSSNKTVSGLNSYISNGGNARILYNDSTDNFNIKIIAVDLNLEELIVVKNAADFKEYIPDNISNSMKSFIKKIHPTNTDSGYRLIARFKENETNYFATYLAFPSNNNWIDDLGVL